MSYKVLYNPALLINEMILFGDILLNMFVNVKLFSNKINLKKSYSIHSGGGSPLQQIRMCQITMPQPQSRQNNFVSTYGSVGGRLFSDQRFCSM